MGKSLDDLNLRDEPLRPAPVSDVRDTAWYQLVEEIEALLATGEYEWASSTLSDIAESVEKFQSVTDGQRRAVRNIAAARRGDGPRGSQRRYEGFRGRRW